MKWKIGNIEIKNRIVMAPMAGFSNTSFRKIIKEMGAGLIYAEMVSDKAIYYESEKHLLCLKWMRWNAQSLNKYLETM